MKMSQAKEERQQREKAKKDADKTKKVLIPTLLACTVQGLGVRCAELGASAARRDGIALALKRLGVAVASAGEPTLAEAATARQQQGRKGLVVVHACKGRHHPLLST